MRTGILTQIDWSLVKYLLKRIFRPYKMIRELERENGHIKIQAYFMSKAMNRALHRLSMLQGHSGTEVCDQKCDDCPFKGTGVTCPAEAIKNPNGDGSKNHLH